jgi:divalent metal cation (Fe/Co/Zn/Cd) transporter
MGGVLRSCALPLTVEWLRRAEEEIQAGVRAGKSPSSSILRELSDALIARWRRRSGVRRWCIGLAITALWLIVMPSLAWGKRRVAARMGSVALKADAAETQLCTYLSVVVLVGLAANALFGWWWMDPVAGLVVAGLAVREGREAWTSGELCNG